MKQTKLIMGMPITVEILDDKVVRADFKKVWDYFRVVDKRFSTYKKDSEISKINNGLPKTKWSREMKSVMALCEQTKQQTKGYFDIVRGGKYDPSGLVKGWAINNAANILSKLGYKNFYVDAGGDVQVNGLNAKKERWKIGIKNPFNQREIVKTIAISSEGLATSGTYIRGQHIYNPLQPMDKLGEVASLTVIGPNIYDADRFATAAFAMGKQGIKFIQSLDGFEGYMIDSAKQAILTSGFEKYVVT